MSRPTLKASVGVVLVCACLALASCNVHPRLYRISEAGWAQDTIHLALRPIDTALHSLPGDAVLSCLSCNLVDSRWDVLIDSVGSIRATIPEATHLVTARLRIQAYGIDSSVIVKQRPPVEAMRFYNLSKPLVGRVLVTQLSLLYRDSLEEHSQAHADPGDELNLFLETQRYFLVHHPLYPDPLYLLKNSAVRLY